MQKHRSELRRIALVAIATAFFMWVMLYAPTPYVLYEPGIAVPVRNMVKIEEGDRIGKGDLLLTAVKLTEPNFWGAIKTVWNSDTDLHLKSDVFRGSSQKQYAERLSVIMQGSQNTAIEAAYRYAKLPFETKVNAIVISDVDNSDHLLQGSFKAGDKLLGIKGGVRFDSAEQLYEALRSMAGQGDFSIDIERSGKRLPVKIFSGILNSSLSDAQLIGALGISSLTELRSLVPTDSRNQLNITAGDIGGPSAGLVFALYSLDLLTEGDLTDGHRIAATGTIAGDGQVGAIGGIKQKVVITSQQGAELFLVPADNYKAAKAKAKALGTSMKVVSVATLQQAMDEIEAFKEASK